MGDTLKKVKPGEPLAIPAATFNTFVDAARDFLSRQRNTSRTPTVDNQPFSTILIKNNSGSDRSRFEVLGIDGPLFTPTDNLDSFRNQIVLIGSTPSDTPHAGKIAVLVEPIQSGKVGRACVNGVVPVKVNISDANHKFADVYNGTAGNLKSDFFGAAQILWAESGTGLKWAVVRLGNPSGQTELHPAWS